MNTNHAWLPNATFMVSCPVSAGPVLIYLNCPPISLPFTNSSQQTKKTHFSLWFHSWCGKRLEMAEKGLCSKHVRQSSIDTEPKTLLEEEIKLARVCYHFWLLYYFVVSICIWYKIDMIDYYLSYRRLLC